MILKNKKKGTKRTYLQNRGRVMDEKQTSSGIREGRDKFGDWD